VQAGLFTADRMVVYWTNQIMQRINEPKLVFSCARGLLDNVLYQGIIGGAPIEMLLWMNQNIPKSDLYIAMTVDGLIGHQRCLSRERGGGEKVSPNETPESIDNFAAAYRKLPEIFPNHNIKFIDTTYLTKEKTLESCWSYVKEML
jgi:thymidylate kinase